MKASLVLFDNLIYISEHKKITAWTYVLLSWIATAFILNAYSNMVAPVIPPGNLYREFFICGGQIVFQSIIVAMLDVKKVHLYLVNMTTISLAGGLFLLPGLAVIPSWFNQTSYPALLWFGSTVFLMLLAHIRLLKALQLHWLLTVTWIGYRFLILITII